MSLELAVRLTCTGASRFVPGQGSAGWTLMSFTSETERDAFMQAHPDAAMPSWKRIKTQHDTAKPWDNWT